MVVKKSTSWIRIGQRPFKKQEKFSFSAKSVNFPPTNCRVDQMPPTGKIYEPLDFCPPVHQHDETLGDCAAIKYSSGLLHFVYL